jgi:hypothetical protein
MHIDKIFFFFVVGALLLKWLFQRFQTDAPAWDSPDELETRPPALTEEERTRRFLEALGQPTTAKPPPKISRRSAPIAPRKISRLPRRLVNPLPVLTTAPPNEAVAPTGAPVYQTAEAILPSPTRALAIERPFAIEASESATPALQNSLGKRLASSASLRDAIVLREIFGPPRSLQPADDLRSF